MSQNQNQSRECKRMKLELDNCTEDLKETKKTIKRLKKEQELMKTKLEETKKNNEKFDKCVQRMERLMESTDNNHRSGVKQVTPLKGTEVSSLGNRSIDTWLIASLSIALVTTIIFICIINYKFKKRKHIKEDLEAGDASDSDLIGDGYSSATEADPLDGTSTAPDDCHQ